MSKFYRCNNCGREFEEPTIIETTYEKYNGIQGMLYGSTPLSYCVCPYCYDEDIEEVDEDEEDEE